MESLMDHIQLMGVMDDMAASPNIGAVRTCTLDAEYAHPAEIHEIGVLIEKYRQAGTLSVTLHPYNDSSQKAQFVIKRTQPKPPAPEKPAEEPTHAGLPVAGYRPQNDANVTVVNQHKEIEERLLRAMDVYGQVPEYDKRWLAIARTNMEQAFMALNRAIFVPSRIYLPEDGESNSSET